MVYKGKKKSKRNKLKNEKLEEVEVNKAPHSFVFMRGHVGSNVNQLTMDMRRVMEPFTASNLKIRKKNVLKDFVAVAGPLGVTHFIMFSKTTTSVNMRISRLPHGPTLHFKVHKYCLSRDVVSTVKKPMASQTQFKNSPLLVLNDFSSGGAGPAEHLNGNDPLKLCATMFQNMFPPINVHKLNMNNLKRCVLFNYDTETKLVEFRHYNIAVKSVGLSRKMKVLLTGKQVPDMSRFKDVSDFLTQQGDGSASESEVDAAATLGKVDLPQRMAGRGNFKNNQSAVRLTELGPRLTLELIKIEAGVCEGEIIFHKFITKTPEEIQSLRESRQNKQSLKKTRKLEQERNVERKAKEKELHREKTLEGMKRKEKQATENTADKPKAEKVSALRKRGFRRDGENFNRVQKKNVARRSKPERGPPSKKRKIGPNSAWITVWQWLACIDSDQNLVCHSI